MRVLFSASNSARSAPLPHLGAEQIVCGPDWTNRRAPDGRVRSIATPVGEYDLGALAAKLPPEQQPDVVVCLVDASGRNLPGNLAAFRCPRVLLIADTHHGRSPLLGMMRYLAGEPFDRVVFLHDRHHAVFFHAAGFRNLHWCPGLTFPHNDAAVQAARRVHREPQVAFAEQADNFNPRHTRLLGALASRGLPLDAQALPPGKSLGFFGTSLLGLGASVNGELNLHVLAILASGAALLTDRLSPGSGLDILFSEGREFLAYRDGVELAEHVRDCLANPKETRALGFAGAEWFDEYLSVGRRHAAFRQLAFDGVSRPEFEFSPDETTRVFFGGNAERLRESLIVYEGVQELQPACERVGVALDKNVPEDLLAIFGTLPRVEFSRPGWCDAPALTIFRRDRAATVPVVNAEKLWCCDAGPADFPALAAQFARSGYSPDPAAGDDDGRREPLPLFTRAPAADAEQAAKPNIFERLASEVAPSPAQLAAM